MKLDKLEFSVFKSLEEFRHAKFLLAVSGGMDSVVLAHVFSRMSQKQKLNFGIIHVHHGSKVLYRDQAAAFVKKLAQKLKIKFHSRKNTSRNLISEAELRDFRYQAINDVAYKNKYEVIVVAHQLEDLLETRVIRLMRGTGPQGLVAMKQKDGKLFRPLLNFTRAELKSYAQKWKLKWVEDPSNQDLQPLRNWVRHKFLPLMESKRPGSSMALARSLETLVQFVETQSDGVTQVITNRGIDRDQMLALSPTQKQHVIAAYMRTKGLANYSRSHINEIIKRLNTRRKSFGFRLSKQQWTVSQKHILCTGYIEPKSKI